MSHESRNSTLVVFGDSLSDNGNLFDLIGQPGAAGLGGPSLQRSHLR
jgi:phospholipase/lecithinase/hemolysin